MPVVYLQLCSFANYCKHKHHSDVYRRLTPVLIALLRLHFITKMTFKRLNANILNYISKNNFVGRFVTMCSKTSPYFFLFHMCCDVLAEYTRYGEHQGQAALWGQPSRRLQKTSDRSVSSTACVLEMIRASVISHFHCGYLLGFVAATFKVLLNHDHRAVEFFIRDKYEKRIYYSKNVTNGSSVCNGSKRASTRSSFFYKWCR